MSRSFHFGRKARGVDLHSASELEILERDLTGWNRFAGQNAREYFRRDDLPVYDSGQLSRFNGMSREEKDALVGRFIAFRESKKFSAAA